MATPLVDFERHKHKINDRTNAENSWNLESCSGNARNMWRIYLYMLAWPRGYPLDDRYLTSEQILKLALYKYYKALYLLLYMYMYISYSSEL